jgi:hypothetical protein
MVGVSGRSTKAAFAQRRVVRRKGLLASCVAAVPSTTYGEGNTDGKDNPGVG